MARFFSDDIFGRPLFSRNWEADIRHVKIEACDDGEDPLGYRAVFLLKKESARAKKTKSFVVGASFLAQRSHNLIKAGYKAPMTERAIDQIESKIGGALPFPDVEHLARMV